MTILKNVDDVSCIRLLLRVPTVLIGLSAITIAITRHVPCRGPYAIEYAYRPDRVLYRAFLCPVFTASDVPLGHIRRVELSTSGALSSWKWHELS